MYVTDYGDSASFFVALGPINEPHHKIFIATTTLRRSTNYKEQHEFFISNSQLFTVNGVNLVRFAVALRFFLIF